MLDYSIVERSIKEYVEKVQEMLNNRVDDNIIGDYIYYLYSEGKITSDSYRFLSGIIK